MDEKVEKYLDHIEVLKSIEKADFEYQFSDEYKKIQYENFEKIKNSYSLGLEAFKRLNELNSENITLVTDPKGIHEHNIRLSKSDADKYTTLDDAIIDTTVKEFEGIKLNVYQLITGFSVSGHRSDSSDHDTIDFYDIHNRISIT